MKKWHLSKKTIHIALALIVTTLFAVTGCTTLDQALRLTQEIGGTGSITLETPLNLTSVSVENARKEDGAFRADRLDIIHKGKLTGSRIEAHVVGYNRKLIE